MNPQVIVTDSIKHCVFCKGLILTGAQAVSDANKQRFAHPTCYLVQLEHLLSEVAENAEPAQKKTVRTDD